MKIQINSKVILRLNPCADRHEHWKNHYPSFDADILDFLELENITAHDKIWIALRVLPRDLLELFALDCSFSAYASKSVAYSAVHPAVHSAADYAAYSVDAVGYEAYVATTGEAAGGASAYAAYASRAAAYSAVYASKYASKSAGYHQERENQIDALIMLIKGA